MTARTSIAPLAIAGAAGIGALLLLGPRRPSRVVPPPTPPTPHPPGPIPFPVPDPPLPPGPTPAPDPGPLPQPTSLEAIDAHLEAAGVRDFTARELLYLPKAKPPRVDIPPADLIPNLIKLGRLLQAFRDLVGHRVNVAGGWRPAWYNEAVEGAEDSAHIRAAGADAILPADLTNSPSHRSLSLGGGLSLAKLPRCCGAGLLRPQPAPRPFRCRPPRRQRPSLLGEGARALVSRPTHHHLNERPSSMKPLPKTAGTILDRLTDGLNPPWEKETHQR